MGLLKPKTPKNKIILVGVIFVGKCDNGPQATGLLQPLTYPTWNKTGMPNTSYSFWERIGINISLTITTKVSM